MLQSVCESLKFIDVIMIFAVYANTNSPNRDVYAQKRKYQVMQVATKA